MPRSQPARRSAASAVEGAAAASARPGLTRARVLDAAAALADREGIAALTMRRLGSELGVEAMSLYRHVRGKDDLLDGLVDLVVADYADPAPAADDWRETVRVTMTAAHAALTARSWAWALVSSRSAVGPARLRYAEALQQRMLGAGFSPQLAHHALHIVDGTIIGFVGQELRRPTLDAMGPEVAAVARGERVAEFPAISAVIADSTHDHDEEFALMVELVVDGLDRLRARESS